MIQDTMKVEHIAATEMLLVTEVKGLDPVTLVLRDISPGKGHLIVECYCDAWAAYWGAMGDGVTLRAFLRAADADYIANRLMTGNSTRKQVTYLLRIVNVLKQALEASK